MQPQPATGTGPARPNRRQSTAERAEECAATQARLKEEAAARRAALATAAPAAGPRTGQGAPGRA